MYTKNKKTSYTSNICKGLGWIIGLSPDREVLFYLSPRVFYSMNAFMRDVYPCPKKEKNTMQLREVFVMAPSLDTIERQELEFIRRDMERLSLLSQYTADEQSAYQTMLDTEINEMRVLLHTILSDPKIIVVDP